MQPQPDTYLLKPESISSKRKIAEFLIGEIEEEEKTEYNKKKIDKIYFNEDFIFG